ncbi:MAG: transposase [Candidatus Komeilibacteria bacterium]|nr:transposase [Candidatus Komeilibacteria bacterium]
MELYHLLNRGVEKREIFLDDRDRFRFVHGLRLFNSSDAANNTTYLIEKDYNDFVSRYGADAIVDIHGWCLMKNHYHLLLSDRIEGGISMFIRKLNIGYAKYFNKRYDRSGYLFQGRTKKIHINSDAYFLHILNYVHFNPLDYMTSARGWRERALKNPIQAHQYLMAYRWSSYQDYCGKKNFSSLLTMDNFRDSPTKIKKHIFDHSGTNHTDIPLQFLLE